MEDKFDWEGLHLKISPVSSYAPSATSFKGLDTAKILSKAANINSWQQRMALGIAAITLQPLIDSSNKEVDDKTKRVSANRSFSKALVGMSTGIVVRGGCMKAVEYGLKNEKVVNGLAKITADDKTKEAIEKSKDFIKNQGGAKKYAAVIGTIAALGVMLVTNFAVDAPLTNALTNFLDKKFGVDEKAPEGGKNES